MASVGAPSSRLGGLKWVAFLAGAVVLLVGTWLFVGPSNPSSPPSPGSMLYLPLNPGDSAEIAKACEKLVYYEPTPRDVSRGVLVLRVLSDRLTEAQWPEAARAVFVAWQKIHRTPGSQPELEPFAGELLEKMVPYLEVADLAALIRSSNQNDYYKPRIEAALDRLAAREVPADGYAGSRLEALVLASVRTGDYERASRYLGRARVVEGVVEEARAHLARDSRAMELYLAAKAGKPRMREVVELWAPSPADTVTGPALLLAGVELARAGKASRDFRLLRESMAATADLEAGGRYWAEAIRSFVGSLPQKGRYSEEHTLAALVTAYGEIFKEPSFAYGFWRKQADNEHPGWAEASWRVECLKRAYAGAGRDVERMGLIREIVKEHEAYGAHAACRAVVEELAGKLEGAAAKEETAEMMAGTRKKEEADKAVAARKGKEQEEFRLRGQVEALKRQLAELKRGGAPVEGIRNMERSIKDLERRLAE